MSTTSETTARSLECKWWGPYSFNELLSSQDHQKAYSKAGVYLWVDQFASTRPLCYVGKASGNPTLWIRQWQHYTAMIGAQYQLPGIEEAKALPWGMTYTDPNVVETVFNYDRYIALVKRAFDFAARIRIWLCPLDDPEATKTIERQLIYQFQPDPTMRGTKYPPATLQRIVHRHAGWLNDAIKAQFLGDVHFE